MRNLHRPEKNLIIYLLTVKGIRLIDVGLPAFKKMQEVNSFFSVRVILSNLKYTYY